MSKNIRPTDKKIVFILFTFVIFITRHHADSDLTGKKHMIFFVKI